MSADDLMAEREANLRLALSRAVAYADGEAITACEILIDEVVAFLDIDPNTVEIGHALREPADLILDDEPTRCPICAHDDLSVYAASEQREDEADLVGCNVCHWEAALTQEGADARAEATPASFVADPRVKP